jgi:hypothetical protein
MDSASAAMEWRKPGPAISTLGKLTSSPNQPPPAPCRAVALNAMPPSYGPISAQCEQFLRFVAALTADQWRYLERCRMQADSDAWVRRRQHGQGVVDLWPTAMQSALERWEDPNREALIRTLTSLMDAAVTMSPVGVPEATRCLKVTRQAAAALFVRPWLDDAVFDDLYGVMETVISVDTLGEPAPAVAPSTERAASRNPVSLPSLGPGPLPRDLCVKGELTIRDDGTYRVIVHRRGPSQVEWSVAAMGDQQAEPPEDAQATEYILTDDTPRVVHLVAGSWQLTLRLDDSFALRPESRLAGPGNP